MQCLAAHACPVWKVRGEILILLKRAACTRAKPLQHSKNLENQVKGQF